MNVRGCLCHRQEGETEKFYLHFGHHTRMTTFSGLFVVLIASMLTCNTPYLLTKGFSIRDIKGTTEIWTRKRPFVQYSAVEPAGPELNWEESHSQSRLSQKYNIIASEAMEDMVRMYRCIEFDETCWYCLVNSMCSGLS